MKSHLNIDLLVLTIQKKSREQFLKDRLYDAKHVRKLLEEQEKTLEARGKN